MGHIRLGNLPRTRKWQQVIGLLEAGAGTPEVATATLVDNNRTYKVPKVKRWLVRHPRFCLHLPPTGASWLNLVERLFAEVTERCVRRGSYTAVRDLEKALFSYLDMRNHNPKPFVWTASAELILGKVQRLSKRISDSEH